MTRASARRIEDYALIGNMRTCALVDRQGSIDWICVPRFDSPACFAALLGTPENGHWTIAPRDRPRSVSRRYIEDTMVLETTFETDSGCVRLTDFMPLALEDNVTEVVRIATGIRGQVPMRSQARFRFDYGSIIPWVRRANHGITAFAGANALHMTAPVELRGEGWSTVADFVLSEGETVPITLSWFSSFKRSPLPGDPQSQLEQTTQWWREWCEKSTYTGKWRDPVMRSALVLKALTYSETGGIVAAATTSLPEQPGGVRNWDYRFCWLRDATFTLYALLMSGFTEEAKAWRKWLVHVVAAEPSKLQIVYGLAGERWLDERTLPWLQGFDESRPVRIGNSAYTQRQIDVFGEIMDTLQCAREHGLESDDDAWRIQCELIREVERLWAAPSDDIWEQRAGRRHYVHSKVMAWVAVDRLVKAAENFGLRGPVAHWKAIRRNIRETVCREGFNNERNAFVQYFGAHKVDAAALLIPLVGFLPHDDPRVIGTVEAVRRDLMAGGFVMRYLTDGLDGLPPGEGTFLPCTLWLADCLTLMGRYDEAEEIFERVLGICNDVGLLAEEYDPVGRRQLGNFPQAFSHVGIINTARNLTRAGGPAQSRADSAHDQAASARTT